MSLVQAHEKRITRIKMFIHMVFFGAIFSLIVCVLVFWFYLSGIDREFENQGFVKSTFKTYVFNKYIGIPLGRYKQFFIDVEDKYFKYVGKRKVSSKDYNRMVKSLSYKKDRGELLFGSLEKIDLYLKGVKVYFPLYLGFYVLVFSTFSLIGKKHKHIRGARITWGGFFKLKLFWTSIFERASNIKVGPLFIPFKKEVSHFLFMGATRSGKSVTLNQMIASIIKRKEERDLPHKLIVYDLKGEFVSKWYRGNDILFFPFDSRSVKYSLFNEIREDIDYKVISKSLFEPPRSISQNLTFFYEAGGEVFKIALILLKLKGKTKNRDILEFFSRDRFEIIEQMKELPLALQGAVDYLSDSREAAGVLSTIHEKINFLEYLVDCDGPFSFRDYISNENETRSLFIPNISNYKNIFMPLFSFGIDIMIKEVLSLPDDFLRRVFFLIDEFSSLNSIQSIFDFQRESGSKGGSLICAMQDLGDLSRNYGKERLQSFFNNFHSKFMFQLLDPDTQDYASRALGERQVHIRMPSHQYSPKEVGDRESVSVQNSNERIVMASEFALLKKLSCYVQFSDFGSSKIKIPRRFYPSTLPHFVPGGYKIETKKSTGKEDLQKEAVVPQHRKSKVKERGEDFQRNLFEI